jgi:methenyltetrahydrofolate cyclohydrolase
MEHGIDFAEMTLAEFAESLASGQPVPGGGAAAAITAALAASLTSMVVRLSLDRAAYASHAALHAAALGDSDTARVRFLELAQADAAAYAAYRTARLLPHEGAEAEAVRVAATREAARRSSEVPLETVVACQHQQQLVERLVGRSNRHAASDLEVAALLLEAAARSAAANVMANLAAVGDAAYAERAGSRVLASLQDIEASVARAREMIAAGQDRETESA